MILNDQQTVREFVNARRMFCNNKKLLQKTNGLLSSSYSFEDMAFIVSEVDNKLTPEEQSLLLINANLVNANTNSEQVQFPEVISVESLLETSNNSVIATSTQFTEIWNNLTAMVKSLTAINTVTANEIGRIQKFCTQTMVDSNKAVTPHDSTMSLSNLPVELTIQVTDNSNYIESLNIYSNNARVRISKATVATIGSIRDLITNGMKDFSKKSIRSEEADLINHKKQIDSVLSVSQEEENNEITNVVVVTDFAKLAPSIAINSQTLELVYKQLQNNLDLIDLCNKSCALMLNDELDQSVVSFAVVTQKFLINLPVNSRTKDAIKEYCDLFVQSVNTGNQEIAFMLSTAQFIICFNELLVDVIKHASPSTKLEAV